MTLTFVSKLTQTRDYDYILEKKGSAHLNLIDAPITSLDKKVNVFHSGLAVRHAVLSSFLFSLLVIQHPSFICKSFLGKTVHEATPII